MHAMMPLLAQTTFPALRRRRVETLQVNLGYTCNQSCLHCHVNASPQRTEQMDLPTVDLVLQVLTHLKTSSPKLTLDLTGGAPEINAHFRYLVSQARALGVHVIDRCNLTILFEPGHETLATFLAEQGVEVVASLPCYLEDNVDRQRGDGVFAKSIRGLQQLNALGYGKTDLLPLSLVYNPQGPSLPPNQVKLEADYRHFLGEQFGITFTRLYALANMPIQRFGSTLVSKGQFNNYMTLLQGAHRDENLDSVMCRSLVSVGWTGELFDCDFNQQLGLPLRGASLKAPVPHLRDLLSDDLNGRPISVADHCWGCTAGQGSSCGGALA